MGTALQRFKFEEEDYRTERFANHSSLLKNNNDILNLTQPEAVKTVHREYLEAGADIIETNSFNGQKISQGDYNMQDLVLEMNIAASRLAREEADKFSTETKWRLVAGALGPTTCSCSVAPKVEDPSFRNIDFDTVKDAYKEQM